MTRAGALGLAALLAAAAGVASAQKTVYRCGPDGREYSQRPCPGGSAFDASDPRDAAQRAHARQLDAGERRRGTALERERLARDAKAAGPAAARLDARPASPAASKPVPGARKKSTPTTSPDQRTDFTARGPSPAKKPAP